VNVQENFWFSVLGKVIVVLFYIVIFWAFLQLPALLNWFSPRKTINVCCFTETFSPEAIERFEKETGIGVNLTYAEIDEQIYAKFRINDGKDYDVVNLSDFMIDILRDQDLLYPLEKEKLNNQKNIDPRLTGHAYDENNAFCMPHKWYVYGLAYDKAFFKRVPEEMSLDFVFKNPKELHRAGAVPFEYKLSMLDDGRDALFLAAIYLFGGVDRFDSQAFEQIGKLLIAQKKWVEVYTVHSAEYFLFSGVTPIALMSSNYMRKILDKTDRFEFAIPKEGTSLIIENLAIPKKSEKIEYAHKFINFMLSDEIAAINCKAYGYNSSNKNTYHLMDQNKSDNKHLLPDDKIFKRLFVPLLPVSVKKTLDDLWLAVEFA
jgi:spermidine/putrescine transport system substrate-binding protein